MVCQEKSLTAMSRAVLNGRRCAGAGTLMLVCSVVFLYCWVCVRAFRQHIRHWDHTGIFTDAITGAVTPDHAHNHLNLYTGHRTATNTRVGARVGGPLSDVFYSIYRDCIVNQQLGRRAFARELYLIVPHTLLFSSV